MDLCSVIGESGGMLKSIRASLGLAKAHFITPCHKGGVGVEQGGNEMV